MLRGVIAIGLAALALVACSPQPQPYVNQGWGFAASFRGPPKITEKPAVGEAPASILVESNAGGDDFSVNVIDARTSTTTPDQLLASAPQAIASGMGVDVGATATVTSGAVAGREVRFDKDGDPVMRLRVFFANGRLYEISANSQKGVSDPDVDAFFGSFRLLQPPATQTPPPANTASPANAVSTNATEANATAVP